MKALAIAGTDLRRLLRWRANVFFLFLLPMLIILLLGAAFGGSAARIGVVGGTTGLGQRLVAGTRVAGHAALGEGREPEIATQGSLVELHRLAGVAVEMDVGVQVVGMTSLLAVPTSRPGTLAPEEPAGADRAGCLAYQRRSSRRRWHTRRDTWTGVGTLRGAPSRHAASDRRARAGGRLGPDQ